MANVVEDLVSAILKPGLFERPLSIELRGLL
jgi:hypothetical protein